MPSITRTTQLLAAGVAVTLLVGACSSSTKSDVAGTGGSTAGASTGPSGSPITVGSFASLSNPLYSTPQAKAGIDAAIAAVNAAGGVNGHPIKLEFCDSNFDANKELSCARSLIQKKVSAFVSPSALADASGKEYSAMASANVADIGGEGLSPVELNSPIGFPISSGIPGWVYGATKHLIDSGAKKIAIVVDTNPASQFFGTLVKQALQSYGVTAVVSVTADATADPTFSTAAGKLQSAGADGIVLAPTPANIPKLVGAFKQSGFAGQISSVTAIFQPAVVKALGSSANGILLTSTVAFVTDASNPAVATFLAEMKTYQPDAVTDEISLISWAAVKLFAKIAATSTSYDANSILAAAAKFVGPADLGVIAPYAVAGKTSPIEGFSRIFNPTVENGTVENGAIKSDGKGFVNPFPSK